MRNALRSTGPLLAAAAVMAAIAPAAWAAPPSPAPAEVPAKASAPALAPAALLAAPAAPDTKGPLIQGICLLSQDEVIGRSKVGQGATAKLREITQQTQASLREEQTRLQARGKALEAKRATLTPLQLQAQGQALSQRGQALQAEATERSQQIDAAKSKAFHQVIEEAQTFIAQAYRVHGCGLLLAREAVLSGNLGNDLTPEVLTAMDAKAAPVTVELGPVK